MEAERASGRAGLTGPSLAEVLSRSTLTVAERAALAIDLFTCVEEMQRAGLSLSRLDEGAFVLGAQGRLELTDWGMLRHESHGDGASVRQAAEAVCRILGIGPQPGTVLSPVERQAPALAALARVIMNGPPREAGEAAALFREAAGQLASPWELGRSRTALAGAAAAGPPTVAQSVPEAAAPAPQALPPAALPLAATPAPPLVGPAARPAATPPPPVVRPAVPARPVPSDLPGSPRRKSPLVVLGALVGLLVLLVALAGVVALASSRGRTPAAGAAASPPLNPAVSTPNASAPAASARPSASAPASARPSASPSAAAGGAVTDVTLAPQGTCQPGSSCSVRVDVRLKAPPSTTEVVWDFSITDACSGATTQSAGASVTAEAGWTYVYGISSVQLPASRQVKVVARTSSPGSASSAPLSLGSGC